MNEAIHIPIYHKGTSAKKVSTRSHYQPCTGKSHYYSCHSHQQPRPLSPERHQHPVRCSRRERHSRGAVRTLMLATVCVKLFRNPVPMRVRFVYFPMTRPAGWTKVASRRKMLLSCIQYRWASPSYDTNTNTTGTIYLAAIPATLPTRLPERRLWKTLNRRGLCSRRWEN
jgi:hypothetical protein